MTSKCTETKQGICLYCCMLEKGHAGVHKYLWSEETTEKNEDGNPKQIEFETWWE